MNARLFVVAVVPVLAAGCGSSGASPQVARLSTTSTSSSASHGAPIVPAGGTFVRFVTCMRQHGVRAQLGPQGHGVNLVGAVNKVSAGRAQAACQKYLPGGGPPALTPAQQAAQTKAMLAVAKCMRRNGVPNFPDPNAQGHLVGIGIDKSSPAVQSAVQKCTKLIASVKGRRAG